MSELRGYDAWLEAPYQRMYAQEPPGWVQDMLGLEIEQDGYKGVVEDFETWEDADEDGAYGGVELIVRFDSGRRQNMSREEVEECLP